MDGQVGWTENGQGNTCVIVAQCGIWIQETRHEDDITKEAEIYACRRCADVYGHVNNRQVYQVETVVG